MTGHRDSLCKIASNVSSASASKKKKDWIFNAAVHISFISFSSSPLCFSWENYDICVTSAMERAVKEEKASRRCSRTIYDYERQHTHMTSQPELMTLSGIATLSWLLCVSTSSMWYPHRISWSFPFPSSGRIHTLHYENVEKSQHSASMRALPFKHKFCLFFASKQIKIWAFFVLSLKNFTMKKKRSFDRHRRRMKCACLNICWICMSSRINKNPHISRARQSRARTFLIISAKKSDDEHEKEARICLLFA